MDLTTRGKTYLLVAFLSFVFSYLIITGSFFPSLGLSLSLLIFTLFSCLNKKNKNSDTKLYLAFTIFFAMLIGIRSEMFVTFLNFSATLFFGTLMLISGSAKPNGFLDNLFSPLIMMVKSFFTPSDYFLETKTGKKETDKSKSLNTVFGVVVSILILLVVLPLLSSANPFFKKLVEDVLGFFNLIELFKNLGPELVFIWVIRIVFFLGFLFFIPKVLSLINKKNDYSFPLSLKLETFSLILPKIVLSITLLIFFITQFEFYFADKETLNNLGLTLSQHTREVFAQLTIVAGIVMLLLYNDSDKNKTRNSLNWVLGIEGVFLTFMAYKSAIDYMSAWGLTYARLYGVAFATWITGIFYLYFNNYRLKEPSVKFVKRSIVFSGLLLLIVNFLNFDYLIYHFKKAATGQGIDYTFLSTLSPDSLSYKDQYLKLEEATKKDPNYSLLEYNNRSPLLIINKIENLQSKYSNWDLRTFSLLDYLQYMQIKTIDTSKQREIQINKYTNNNLRMNRQ